MSCLQRNQRVLRTTFCDDQETTEAKAVERSVRVKAVFKFGLNRIHRHGDSFGTAADREWEKYGKVKVKHRILDFWVLK